MLRHAIASSYKPCLPDAWLKVDRQLGTPKEAHLRSIAMATAASVRANWSPTHFLAPPPKGMKAKSLATCTMYTLVQLTVI